MSENDKTPLSKALAHGDGIVLFRLDKAAEGFAEVAKLFTATGEQI